MEQLSVRDAAALRQAMARDRTATWTKPEINAATQAIEDAFQRFLPKLSQAIESAAPGVFSASLKKRLVSYWVQRRAKELVGA